MPNWPDAKRWQCPTCLDILTRDELWQQEGTGALLCRTCYIEWCAPPDFLTVQRPDPKLCEECGNGMVPLGTVHSSSFALEDQLCVGCLEIPQEEAHAALLGMLSILEETNEDG